MARLSNLERSFMALSVRLGGHHLEMAHQMVIDGDMERMFMRGLMALSYAFLSEDQVLIGAVYAPDGFEVPAYTCFYIMPWVKYWDSIGKYAAADHYETAVPF